MRRTTKKGIAIIEHMLDGTLRRKRGGRAVRSALLRTVRDAWRMYLHDTGQPADTAMPA